MTDIKQKSRTEWNDKDWATYLGCPVAKVADYRNILDRNYVMSIQRDSRTQQYYFAMYRYDITPSGTKRLQLKYSSKKQFTTTQDALTDANNIISTIELTDFWAKTFKVPNRAIQMLLIRQK